TDQAGLLVVHLPALTGVDEGLQHLAVGRVATHETDLDHPVAGRSGLLDRQGLGDGAGQRFLHQHVLAGLDRRGRPDGVGVVPGADADAVDVIGGQQVMGVVVRAGGAVPVSHRPSPVEVDVGDGDQFDVGVGGVGVQVGGGDGAGADDADAEL